MYDQYDQLQFHRFFNETINEDSELVWYQFLPRIILDNPTLRYSPMINFAMFSSFLFSIFQYFNMKDSKLYILMNISGVSEITIILALFTLDSISILFFSLILAGVIVRDVVIDYSLIFILILIAYYAQYFMNMIIPFSGTSTLRNVLLFIFTLMNILPILSTIFEIYNLKYLSHELLALCIFPQYAFPQLLYNIMLNFIWNQPIHWSNFSAMIHKIPSNTLVSYLVGFLFVYIFIFIILNLMAPRTFGAPPIEFKNILKLRYWKSLFSPRRDIQPSYEEFIKVENISKSYGHKILKNKVDCLKNISLSIAQGEMVVLIGPYASGKTTLLNILSGAESADEGVLKIFGKVVSIGFKEIQRRIGVCLQDNIFMDKLTVYDNLWLFGKFRGIPSKMLNDEIDYIVDSFELRQSISMRAKNLSGGTKRKLCLGCAFIGHPSIVLLDEPTAGIDVSSRQAVWKAISNSRATILFSSHMIEEAESISSRIFVLKNGGILYQGSAQNLRQMYNCGYILTVNFIGELIDDSKINKLCEWAKQFFPDAQVDDMHESSLLIPISDDVSKLLTELESKLNEFEIESYNINMMNIEDTLYTMYLKEDI